MFERIDPRSPTPLYAQIAARIRIAVAAGELTPGSALPSVRTLAAQLRINPATVVQAYRDLEHEGVLEMRQGAGTFIANLPVERRMRARLAEARRLAREAIASAERLGIAGTELLHALEAELQEPRS